jgi:hypothetical protein
MFLDISSYIQNETAMWVLIGVLALVLLICVIKCTADGIVKCLFNLAYFALFIVMIAFLGPLVASWLKPIGFWENLLSINASLESALSFIDADLAYFICAILIILVAFMIIVFILNRVFRKVKNIKNKQSRFVGFIYGFFIFFILSAAFLELFTSPFLVKGGKQLVDKASYLKLYNNHVTEPVFEIFDKEGVPFSVDGAFVAGYSGAKDNKKVYLEAFKQYETYMLNSNEYVKTLKDGSNYNEEKVNNAALNYCRVVDVATCSTSFGYAKLKDTLKNSANDWYAKIPKELLSGETKTQLEQAFNRLGVSLE